MTRPRLVASRMHQQAGMGAIAYDMAVRVPGGYRDISPLAAFHARRSARLVDIREPHELDTGYIEGSENVPLNQLAARARQWDRDADLILICRSGSRSALAARQLALEGFRRVMNVSGGLLAHVAAGLPVVRR